MIFHAVIQFTIDTIQPKFKGYQDAFRPVPRGHHQLAFSLMFLYHKLHLVLVYILSQYLIAHEI